MTKDFTFVSDYEVITIQDCDSLELAMERLKGLLRSNSAYRFKLSDINEGEEE